MSDPVSTVSLIMSLEDRDERVAWLEQLLQIRRLSATVFNPPGG